MLRSLQPRKGRSAWFERFFGSAGWLLVLSTLAVLWLPWPGKTLIEAGAIQWVLAGFVVYLLSLEVSSRVFSRRYDELLFRLVRIVVATATVSLLVWFSGGGESYFWFFYSLPILQAILYLSGWPVLVVALGSIGVYWGVVLVAAVRSAQVPDLAFLVMNSLILMVLGFLVYTLFEAAKRSRKVEHFETLQAAQELAPAVDTDINLGDLLQSVIKQAVKATNAAGGSIMLLDRRTDTLKLECRHPPTRPWWKEAREFKLGEGIAGWVAQHRRSWLCSDVTQEPRFAPALEAGSIGSLLAVPIVAHGQALGVISVDSPAVDGFDTNDEQLLLALSSHLADRIERARLLDALYALGTSATMDLSNALRVALEQLARVVGYDSAAIWLVEDGQAKVGAAQGFPDGQPVHGLAYATARDALHTEMSRTKRPLVIDDARKDRRFRALGGTTWVRGWLGAPLVVGGKIIGILTLDSRQVGYFDQADAELVAVLARHVAVTIEDARLLEHHQRWARELETLRRTALDITAQVDEERLLKTIIQRAVELLHAKSGGIFGYNQAKGELMVLADWGADREILGTTLKVGDGVAGQVVQTGEPCIVDDYGRWPQRAPAYEPYLCRAVVGVPLCWQEAILGVLYVTDEAEGRFFTGRDAELLGLLASQAVIAMQNVRLLEEARHRARELQRKAQQLKLVNEMTALVGSRLDTAHILQTAVTEMAKVFDVRQCGVVLFDHEAGYGEVRAEYQEDPDSTAQGLRIPIAGNASMEWILKEKRALAIENARNDPLLDGVRDVVEARGIRSLLLVPLLVGGRVFGTIGLDELDGPRHFSDDEIELAETIARQVSVTIENAELFAQTQRRAEALSAMHETSLDLTRHRQLPELVQCILDRGVALLQAQGGGLYLLDETGQNMRLTAVENMPTDLIGQSFDAGDGVVGHVIAKKEPLSISHYQSWPHRLRQYDQLEFTSVVGAPIAWQDEVWGAIAIHDTAVGRTFDEEEMNLLSHLGNLAAVALESARRLDELERLMASAIDALIVADETGRIVKLNKRAEQILGYGPGELIGQSVRHVYHDPDEASRVKHLMEETEEGRIADRDTFVRSKDGEKIPIRLSASLLYDYEDKRAGSVGFFRDLREIESAKRQIRYLNGLLAAGRAITRQLDLSTVLDAITSNAMEALDDVDAVVLYLYDQEKDEFQVPPIIKGLRHPEFLRMPFKQDSVVTRVKAKGEAHFAEDARIDPVTAGDFVHREGIASSASVPLEVGGEILGVIFFNYREARHFTEEERSVIEILANEAAIAIQNARLYAAEQLRSMQLEAMHRISMAADAAPSVTGALQNALAEMVQVMDMDQGGVVLLDVQEGSGRTVAEYPQSKDPDVDIDMKDNESMQWILEHRRPLAITDAMNDPRLEAIGRAVEGWGIKSMLLVPVVVRDEVIGTVGLDAIRERHEFTVEEVELAEMMARQVAIALENSQAQEDLRAVQTVNSAFVLLSRWAHKVRQKGFALGHDLRTLRHALPIGLFDEILNRMEEIIQELALPATVLMTEDEARGELVEVGDLLRNVAVRLCCDRKVPIEATQDLDDDPCLAAASELLLEIAVEMLVENAVESVEDRGQPGRVHVKCHRSNGHIRARISDTGSGIERDVLKGLFHGQVESDRGHGYGSFTAASVLRAYGGDVRVVRTGPEGTIVEFWLPAAR